VSCNKCVNGLCTGIIGYKFRAAKEGVAENCPNCGACMSRALTSNFLCNQCQSPWPRVIPFTRGCDCAGDTSLGPICFHTNRGIDPAYEAQCYKCGRCQFGHRGYSVTIPNYTCINCGAPWSATGVSSPQRSPTNTRPLVKCTSCTGKSEHPDVDNYNLTYKPYCSCGACYKNNFVARYGKCGLCLASWPLHPISDPDAGRAIADNEKAILAAARKLNLRLW
jgi:hypothetical protein